MQSQKLLHTSFKKLHKWLTVVNLLFLASACLILCCDSTVVSIYKLKIHYIVNIIHLFWSLFGQLYNIFWSRLCSTYSRWMKFHMWYCFQGKQPVYYHKPLQIWWACIIFIEISLYYFTIYTWTCSYFICIGGCYHVILCSNLCNNLRNCSI